MDYFETFAPTTKAHSICVLIAIAGTENLELVEFDIKATYLYANLFKEIYKDLPDGFEKMIYSTFPNGMQYAAFQKEFMANNS